MYDELGHLPHFNPDSEAQAPAVVRHWQALLRGCDTIVIACLEYAHGIPGAFKNALDWVVGTAGLEGKPVALRNTAAHARHAQEQLAEVITTMGWRIIDEASKTIPVARKDVVVNASFPGPEAAELLWQALATLVLAAGVHGGKTTLVNKG